MTWISIEDGLPEISKDVLLFCEDGRQYTGYLWPHGDDPKYFALECWELHGYNKPTHWMPLPNPPCT